jgi:putative DNA primase/helicase
MTFLVTKFADLTAGSLTTEEMGLDELGELIDGTVVPHPEEMPTIRLTKFGTSRSEKGCLRHDANVIHHSGWQADHDSGTMPLDEAKARLEAAGIACVLHTTKRHTAATPRWRATGPFAKPIPPGDYAKYIDRINGALGGTLAKESWSQSQSFYAGHVVGVPFEIFVFDNEECLDDVDELAAGAQPYRAPAGAKTGAPGAAIDFKTADELDLIEAIKTGQHYYRAACELAWRWAHQSVPQDDAKAMLAGFLDAVPVPQRDRKWTKAQANLGGWIARAFARADADITAKRQNKGGGRPLVFTKPDPSPQPVDGAELLDELTSTIRSFIVMPEVAQHAVALWIVHSYVFGTMMVTPRLVVKSAQKRCGKTTLLLLLEALCARTLSSASISPASVYRVVELAQPTLLIDEGDVFINDNPELRALLAAGYLRGAQTTRVVGEAHEPRQFSCWSPAAIATIKPLHDTLEDRSIVVALERKVRGEKVTRLRIDRLQQMAPLTSKIQRWSDDNITALEQADPDVPEALNDRAADCWRILVAVAECAGGEWPERARKAALKLSSDNEDIETVATMLLADLRDLFEASGHDELFTAEIIGALIRMEERPWAEYGEPPRPFSRTQLARLLRPFKVKPKNVRRAGTQQQAKGYELKQLEELFKRYLG